MDFGGLLGAQWAQELLTLFRAEVTRAEDEQRLVNIGQLPPGVAGLVEVDGCHFATLVAWRAPSIGLKLA